VLTEVSESDAGATAPAWFCSSMNCHTVVSSDRSKFADCGSILNRCWPRGDWRLHRAPPRKTFRRTWRRNPPSTRRFQQGGDPRNRVEVSVEILPRLKERYELHHGVHHHRRGSGGRRIGLADRYIADALPARTRDRT